MIPIKNIDSFIKTLSELSIQNPSLEITPNFVYSQFVDYGLTNEEKTDNYIGHQTDALVASFNKAQNIDVYYSDQQPGFLQFRSKKLTTPDSKCVKMYINIPKDYISYAAYKIFDFIDKNNIETLSKIACKVRSDCIVMRVPNPNQAKMVMDFINNDKDLKKIARSTNPFSIKNGLVAMGYDDLLSYNSVVSDVLSSYINDLRVNNQLENASIEGFNNFLIQYREDVFHNCSKLSELTSKPEFIKYSNSSRFSYNPGKLIVNYEQIYRLLNFTVNKAVERKKSPFGLLANQRDKEDTEEFLSFYNGCLERQRLNEVAEQYNNVLSVQRENAKNSIDDYIRYVVQFESPASVITRLQSFYNGRDDAITRKYGFRSKFVQMGRNQFGSIVGSNLSSYVYDVLSKSNNMSNAYVPVANNTDDTYIPDNNSNNSNNSNNDAQANYLEEYNKFCKASSNILLNVGVVGLIRALGAASTGNFMYFGESFENSLRPDYIKTFCQFYLESIGYKSRSQDDIIVDFATELDKVVRPNTKTQQY